MNLTLSYFVYFLVSDLTAIKEIGEKMSNQLNDENLDQQGTSKVGLIIFLDFCVLHNERNFGRGFSEFEGRIERFFVWNF